jgi:hypothetical protein
MFVLFIQLKAEVIAFYCQDIETVTFCSNKKVCTALNPVRLTLNEGLILHKLHKYHTFSDVYII